MNSVITQLIQLIYNHTGLQIREQDKTYFHSKISSRMKSLKLNTLEEYYQLLLGTRSNTISYLEKYSQNEWKELVLLLTIGETYFFRDQGQFSLLRNKLLPELIADKIKNSDIYNQKPSLRIWSAGCSSGEEPYSLAILVKELIPDLNEWNISIIGTDINSQSIEKAQQGIYDPWSFRQVSPQLQKQYFHQCKMRWSVDEQIRKMVKFYCFNLFQSAFQSQINDIQSMDLIMCRNVFIYFDSQAIATVVEKFYHTLSPGGYLIAGHAELHGQNLGQLQPKSFPESVVYQRSDLPIAANVINFNSTKILQTQSTPTEKKPTIKPLPVVNLTATKSVTSIARSEKRSPSFNRVEKPSQPTLTEAKTFFDLGEYNQAIQAAKQVLGQHPREFDAYYLIAQAWANLGDSQQAVEWCQQALKINELSEKPYYLLAHLAEEEGDFDKAKALFKKIIYLAPSSIGAYLEIGSIYAKEGDRNRAKKMLTTAWDLIKKLSPDSPIESYRNIPASELDLQVKNMLKLYN